MEAYNEARRQKLIPQQEAPKSSADAWSSDRQRLAYDLCKTEFGKKAARDGWALQLWDFCRNHGPVADRREDQEIYPDGFQIQRRTSRRDRVVQARSQGFRGQPTPTPIAIHGRVSASPSSLPTRSSSVESDLRQPSLVKPLSCCQA
jgi:hypothetical protein